VKLLVMNRVVEKPNEIVLRQLQDAGIRVRFFEPNKLTGDEKELESAAKEIVNETIDKAVKFLSKFQSPPRLSGTEYYKNLGEALKALEQRCVIHKEELHKLEDHDEGASPFVSKMQPTSVDPNPLPFRETHECSCKEFTPAELLEMCEIRKLTNIEWPTNGNFTQEFGMKKVEEYISQWPTREKWLYYIDFIHSKDSQFGTKYIYEVKWSAPTKDQPVVPATASVFFTLEVSDFKAEHTPVKVTFQFETKQLKHSPETAYFCDEWLQDIVNTKLQNIMKFPSNLQHLQ